MKILIFFKLFIIFWLHWVFAAARAFSLVAMSEGYFLVVCRLLIAVASLVMDTGSRAHRLGGCGPQA